MSVLALATTYGNYTLMLQHLSSIPLLSEKQQMEKQQMPLIFQPMPLSRRAKPFNHPEWYDLEIEVIDA